MAKTTIDSDKEKDSGDINPWKDANKAPEIPPNEAPIANASNFKLRVFRPIAWAAVSSSRMATQARPILESWIRKLTISTAITKIRNK